jgi:DNA-binding MarR family transcriptional regulator
MLPAGWNEALPGIDSDTMHMVIWLGRLSRIWEINLESTFRAHGVNAAEMRVLMTLLCAGDGAELSVNQVGYGVILTSSGVTKAIDRMHRLGYIGKRQSSEDRRSTLISLNPSGRTIAGKAVRDLVGSFEDCFPKGETEKRALIQSALITLLGRIRLA